MNTNAYIAGMMDGKKLKKKKQHSKSKNITVRYRHLDRAKWTADGCKTLLEIADAFQTKADHYRQLHEQGASLCDEVNDDYWWFTIPGHEQVVKKPDLPEEVFNKFSDDIDDDEFEERIFNQENEQCPVCESEKQ